MPTEIEKVVAAFQDSGISEIMINDDGSVYVERGAALDKLDAQVTAGDVAALLKALVGDAGIGAQRPYADLSAGDGSRVHVIAPPLVKGGVAITIRKRPQSRPSLEQLAHGDALSPECAGFLEYAVEHKKNILFVGGTSSGKTTLLSALAARLDPKSRVLVLEDTPELALPLPHVMYLKTRLRDASGASDVTLADLLRNTLRMRPDRIIVGEVRGAEAFDMMQAMNVGQEGTMCTLHANSCREALLRLETLVLMSGVEMPLRAVRSNIAMAIDLIVQMSRLSDGSRRVVEVSEITGMELDNITMSSLFQTESRKGAKGMSFTLKPTGSRPKFYDQLRQQGIEPLDFFKTN